MKIQNTTTTILRHDPQNLLGRSPQWHQPVLRCAGAAFLAGAAAALVGCTAEVGAIRNLSEARVPSPPTAPRISQVALPTDIVGAEGTDEAAWLGYCVAVGDFNGDGREDIAAGMPGAEGRRGAVAIVYGGATGLNLRSPDLSTRTRLTAGALTEFTAAIGDQIGSAVAAGDFDGDGYTDLAIGAPCRAAGGSAGAGQVIIVYGDRGMGAARLLQRRQVVTQTGAGANEVNDHFGAALAAGDFNGDGYVDLAIGAPDEDLDQRASVGVVFIRFGSARGLTSEGYHYISAATRSPGTGANSTEAGERFGGILAAGPLHRPAEGRVDDLVVGAPGKDISIYSASAGFRNVNFANAGKVYVFEGARSAHTLRHRVDILPGTWPLGIEGFGSSLAIGDFDGDLNPDLAVGAPNAGDDTEHSGGRVYVMNYNPVNGSVGRRAFPDERNTQYLRQPDEVLSEVPIAKVENGDRYGFSLVAADFNGDSFFDLAVGAPWEDWNQANDTGLVFLLLGGSDGLSAAFGCTYSFLDQAPVGGNEAGDRFGFALAAGDIDGDESPDLVVGAPYEDRPASRDGGAVFLARTTTVAAGAFDGVWSGTIQGDNRTSATLRLFLCDRDGVVSGSGFLDDDLERDACGETVTLGREADVLAGDRVSASHARGRLVNLELPDDVRAEVEVDLRVNAARDTLTGTIQVRNVQVRLPGLGWVNADDLPSCNPNIDVPVTLTREP